VIFQILISIFYELEVVKVIEKYFNCGMQSHFEVAKQWQVTDDTDGLLRVGSGEFLVFKSVLFCDLDLLKVTDTKEHSFPSINGGLEVEKIIILILVMRGVGH
jgi:hypothetical protein